LLVAVWTLVGVDGGTLDIQSEKANAKSGVTMCLTKHESINQANNDVVIM